MWEIFFVLRQTIFQSQPNDFSISGERFFNLRRTIFRSAASDFPFSVRRFPVLQRTVLELADNVFQFLNVLPTSFFPNRNRLRAGLACCRRVPFLR